MTTTPSISRRGLIAGATAMAALGATGCAAKAGETAKPANSGAASGGSVTVNEAGSITLLGFSGEHTKEQFAAFEKVTNIKVNLTEYTYDKLVAMLAAGNAPDVVRGEGGLDAAFLWTKKMAEPLDAYIEKSQVLKKDDLAPINNLWRYNGTKQGEGDLMGLIKDYSNDFCVWVNKALVPEVKDGEVLTYDRLLELALAKTQIEGGRVKTYGFDFYDDKPHLQFINMFAKSAGKEIFNADLSEVDLTSDEAVKAVDFMRKLIDAKATISVFNKSTVDQYSLFKAGRLAFLQSGYWTQGMWADGKPEIVKNFVMLPAPTAGPTRISPVLAGSGHFMPAASKKKDLAWKFMEDYFAGQPAKDRAASGWGIPGLKSLMPLIPEKTELNKTTLACQKGEEQYFQVLPFTPYAKIASLKTIIGKEMEQGIKANKPTAEICSSMTKALNTQLSRGKAR